MKYNKKLMATDLHMALFEKRMTLREASKKVKVSVATLSRMQNEGMPDLLTYAKVCKFLDSPLARYISN